MTATLTPEAAGTDQEAGAPGRRHATVDTELGELTLVAEGDSLVGVYFPDHRPAPALDGFGPGVEADGDPVLKEAAAQVVDYATGRRGTFDLPLRPVGSERARQLWGLIAAVPRGETTSYAALGRAVGVGPRAAGQFVARNPLSVVVPCHRVVASDGRLTGYAGGVDRKRRLLELEGALEPGAAVVRPPASPELVTAAGSTEADEQAVEAVEAVEAEGRG